MSRTYLKERDEENERRIRLAGHLAMELVRQALKTGQSGAFGVRVPVQRNKVGNVRKIIESEVS